MRAYIVGCNAPFIGYTPVMSHARAAYVGLGILLSFVLLFGNPAHALIPHAHSHDAGGGESAIWQSLHSVLRHEDKQALPTFGVLAVITAAMFSQRTSSRASRPVTVDSLLDQLRRGIVPHRRFG